MHLPDHSQFDAALQQPRPQLAPQRTLFAAWRALWRSAPAKTRLDLVRLALMTPAMMICFAVVWWVLPA